MAGTHPEGGATLTGHFRVEEKHLASAISDVPTDVYARVLATPHVCGFMETVAARMLVPYLQPGELSVGVRVDLRHTAATQVDEDVSVTAKFLRKDGKVFVFDVVANDAAGEIGKAYHERAIIEEKRLYAGAKKRSSSRSKI